ncbi:MAG: ribonuclease HII [Spirochaetes bacterium]|nr:ribonuclease HII [Spirochaetota bacterium]
MVLGIDEAGRGPIAGPLVVGGVIFDSNKYFLDDSNYLSIRDSKILTPSKREELFKYIKSISIFSEVVCYNNKIIDKYGISYVLKLSIIKIIEKAFERGLKLSKIIFDGNFNPIKNSSFYKENILDKEIVFQNIIKADRKIKEVSAASILAKVIRDRILKGYSKVYPHYRFEKNKGYGTSEHIELIKRYGYSEIHRKSFLIKNLNIQNLF